MSTIIDVVVAWAFLIEYPLYLAVCVRLAWRFTEVLDLIDVYFEERWDVPFHD